MLHLAMLGLLFGLSGTPAAAQAAGAAGPPGGVREGPRRWSAGAALGALFAPGEVGRGRSKTGGGEQLIARWGNGVALGFQAAFDARFGGFELSGLMASSAVQVRNESGAAFPNHGRHPFAWSANGLVYPLAPLQGRRSRLPRPFITGGLGGVLLSVDLDNVRGQTLYHSFHWSIGGGVRIALSRDEVPSWTPMFVELRVARLRVWPNGPLRRFEVIAATAGLGTRF